MDQLDLVILGAGPAGLSAAMVATGNLIRTVILEAGQRVGGQIQLADHPITDLLGRDARDGTELIEHLERQAADHQLDIRRNNRVERVVKIGDNFQVHIAGGAPLQTKTLLLATGCRARAIGVANEEELGAFDRARPLAEKLAGKKVIIAGAGDEAASTAELLASAGAEVTMLVRGPALTARPLFVRSLLATPNVSIHFGESVIALEKDGTVRTKSGLTLRADRFFTRIGSDVTLPPIDPAPARAGDGRVITDDLARTDVPGLFAAGDLTASPPRRYIAFAAGAGVVAARAIEQALREGVRR